MQTRHCPVCRIPVHPFAVGQTQIDVCPTCRGIWFDRGELSRIQRHGGVPDKFLAAAPLSTVRDRVACPICRAHNDRSSRECRRCGAAVTFLCPACRQQLEEAPVGSIMVDRCQRCQGVWFDGGELAILFAEFTRRKKAEIARIRSEGGAMRDDPAAWAAPDALDLLIWRPDVAYHAGRALGDVAAQLPGAVAQGVGAAGELIGDLPEFAGSAAATAGKLIGAVPEMAGNMAEFAGDVIGNVPEMAGNMAEFAGDVIGNVPEMAGALAEAGASFLEMLFDLIGSLFD